MPASKSGPGGRAGGPKGEDPNDRTVATNRRARYEYAIEDRFEAGLVLTGPEVKSIRLGRASLAEAFGRIRDDQAWLEGMHIAPYEPADQRGYEPRRPRKLLMHREEIRRLGGKLAEKGFTLVPLRLYFTHGIVKVELGLARGKRYYEKREAIAEREHRREVERTFGARGRSDGSADAAR